MMMNGGDSSRGFAPTLNVAPKFLEDEMSKFEQELSSLQQVNTNVPTTQPQVAPLRPPPVTQFAFTPPQVMLRHPNPSLMQHMPLLPPRPPPMLFTGAATTHIPRQLQPFRAPPVYLAPAVPQRPPQYISSQTQFANMNQNSNNANINQNTGISNGSIGRGATSEDAKSTSYKFESSKSVIESSPSIYKTPKQPTPTIQPGPVPIAPQIKNPQPVTLPRELEESLNAAVNIDSSTDYVSIHSSQPSTSDSTAPSLSVAAETPKSAASGKNAAGPSKPKKFIRAAGGEVWEDLTLNDWDKNDFRIFCGDLGNEVTDDHLRRAFSHYPSLQKVKVVRDKKSQKTRGYGFLSFSDSNDYVRAMKEMNGKYVGNRPIKLRKSSWQERDIHQVRKKEKLKKKLGLR